jgi:hypothetical protein
MRSLLKPLLFAPMLTLASCASLQSPRQQVAPPALTPPSTQTPKDIGGIDPLCPVLRPISLSHADTDGTKAQVIAQNEVIDKACGGKP